MKPGSPASILRNAFNRLKLENRRVSLRSVAKRVGISSSYLSKLMTGQKSIPLKLVSTLSIGVHLDTMETECLQMKILEELESNKATNLTGLKVIHKNSLKLEEYINYTKQDNILLEKWYYIPLLNLTTLKGFRTDIGWISKRLNLKRDEVVNAIKLLVDQGYLLYNDDQLIVNSKKARFQTTKSTFQIRQYHQIMMKKAISELDKKTSQSDFDNRLINSISFAGNSNKIKQAQLILNQALYEVAELMASSEPDHVFQINLQFFKTTE